MRITFLGHAGFCVETAQAIVITDPWLSPSGAFDSAWFQYPRNHHLAAYVQDRLADARKERFLYISHEHKDHFDPAFLASLRSRDFTVVIADFRRAYLKSAFAEYRCKGVVACGDGEEVEIPGGRLKLYLDDSELNRDSAILIEGDGQSFLNLNDCRIFDSIPTIAREEAPIDVFTCQFSGAGWHPTCYEYPRETYETIARKKTIAKFHSVAKAIRTVAPRVFVPSAGPPCFLDPVLSRLNFEAVNIFPRAPKLLDFLRPRLKTVDTSLLELMPGDVLDVETGTIAYATKDRVSEETLEPYIRAYAASYEGFFLERQRLYQDRDGGVAVLGRLQRALEEKLNVLTLHDRVQTPLYFRLDDVPERMLRVDFPAKRVAFTSEIEDEEQYSITAPSWEVARVLDEKITWDDFSLTFRMRLNREPDLHQTVLQGFLRLEPEDMNWFCSKLLNIESNQERVVVEAGGRRYAIDRYCPHQGGDLTEGWIEEGRFLTCARHQWQFDLERDGQALKNEGSIHAVCLDDD
jgi:UDP-MurNAc hydroxylase